MSEPPKPFDVFLSHATPDRTSVEVLARRLRQDGLDPFLDKWHLVPGEPWQEALEEALKASRTCAVLVGQGQNMEMRAALTRRSRDRALRVIPVLLPGAPDLDERPSFLEQFTLVDFRAGLIYGVMSYTVAQRRREIGVRIALGADRGAVRRLFLVRGLRMVIPGLALGLLGAGAAGQLLRSVLFDVEAADPWAVGASLAVLTAVAAVGVALPALRATRVEPADTLRQE